MKYPKKSTIVTGSVCAAILLLMGWFTYQAATTSSNKNDVSNSPAASALVPSDDSAAFTDFAGNQQSLDQYLGSIIIVHSWASWVPSSPSSLRDLAKLQAEYEDKNVVVLAINRSESRSVAQQFLAQVQVQNLTIIADESDTYFAAIEGYTMPETVFYDSTGEVFLHATSELSYEQLVTYTNQALRTE